MTKNHIHKYRRVNIGHNGTEYWVMQCSEPGCPHYHPMQTKLSAPTLRGKQALCNRCEEPFLLNKRALRMAEPCCDNCVNKKPNAIVDKAKNFWEELEKEAGKG